MFAEFVALLFVPAVAVTIAGAFVYLYRRYRQSCECWENLRDELGLEEKNDYCLEGTVSGEPITIEYHPGRRYSRASLSIRIRGSFDHVPTATLRPERWWDWLGKRSGLSEELQATEEQFNEAVYVSVDDRRFRRILRSSTFRDTTRGLLTSRHAKISIRSGDYRGNGLVWKTKAYTGFWKVLTPDRVSERINQLTACRDGLQELDDRLPASRESTSADQFEGSAPLVTWTGYGVPILSVFGGLIVLFWSTYYPTLTNRLQWLGLRSAAVVFVFYLPFGYLTCRGHSRGHKEFLGLSCCAFFGLVFLGLGALPLVNGLLDSRRPSVQTATVQAVDLENGEYTATFKLRYEGVAGTPELEVADRFHDRFDAGDRVRLTVYPGYLEEPWVGRLRTRTN